ncbi:MAG: hypothetical protein IJE42_07970 [Bacteroidaceae bacterium]|nr:hypothetical protein [Bacteroidales bacterium]MBQ2878849.1 hypothetical protein [Bacteroidaceae bacterium]MBQ3189334.1 hypothetical protein [Bacteroidaceae bacterium]
MKNKLNKTVSEIRKEAVIETFFRSMKILSAKNPLVSQKEIIEHAVKSMAPRFFTSYESARRLVSLMVRKKRLPIINKNKLEMYKEIYRRFIKQSKEAIMNYGSYRLLEEIIESPAPSFYMDSDTFQGILYKTLRERSSHKYVSSINTDIL